MSKPLTREQREALLRLYNRRVNWNAKPKTYLAFRRMARQTHMGCIVVPWANMWIGIEPDGYTHS